MHLLTTSRDIALSQSMRRRFQGACGPGWLSEVHRRVVPHCGPDELLIFDIGAVPLYFGLTVFMIHRGVSHIALTVKTCLSPVGVLAWLDLGVPSYLVRLFGRPRSASPQLFHDHLLLTIQRR